MRVLGDALEDAALQPNPGDVLVVTHKIVSKAEGRYVTLADVTRSLRAGVRPRQHDAAMGCRLR